MIISVIISDCVFCLVIGIVIVIISIIIVIIRLIFATDKPFSLTLFLSLSLSLSLALSLSALIFLFFLFHFRLRSATVVSVHTVVRYCCESASLALTDFLSLSLIFSFAPVNLFVRTVSPAAAD